MNRIERLALGGALVVLASPAFAGSPVTPAPVVGIGVGAVLLVGLGYRALKSRIDR